MVSYDIYIYLKINILHFGTLPTYSIAPSTLVLHNPQLNGKL